MLFSLSSFKPPMLGNYCSLATALSTGAGSLSVCACVCEGASACVGRGKRGRRQAREPNGELSSYFTLALRVAKADQAAFGARQRLPRLLKATQSPEPNPSSAALSSLASFHPPQKLPPLFPQIGLSKNVCSGRLTAGVKKQLLELMFLPPTPEDGCALPRESEGERAGTRDALARQFRAGGSSGADGRASLHKQAGAWTLKAPQIHVHFHSDLRASRRPRFLPIPTLAALSKSGSNSLCFDVSLT